jgi:hypothetical protein
VNSLGKVVEIYSLAPNELHVGQHSLASGSGTMWVPDETLCGSL